jgi:hypothetical protein
VAVRPAGAQAQTQSITFELNRLGNGDKVVGISAIVLIIDMFLAWFHAGGFRAAIINGVSVSIPSVSANAFARGYMYLTLLMALALVTYLVSRAIAWEGIKVPLVHWQILGVGAAVDLLLTLVAFLTKPSGVGWSFGAFIGLLAAIVAAVGVFLAKNETAIQS